jgi:hypothetical protein
VLRASGRRTLSLRPYAWLVSFARLLVHDAIKDEEKDDEAQATEGEDCRARKQDHAKDE